jgi:hypothetical protein
VFSTGISSADVIEPGQKTIPISYQLSNIQDYSDYVFILHGTPNPSMEVLNSSEFSFYKLSICSIYAVPRTVYDSVQLDEMNETQVEQFLTNDSRVARSNLQLDGTYGTVSDSNPLQSALIMLKINSIQGNDLDIEKTSILYSYEMVKLRKNNSLPRIRPLNQIIQALGGINLFHSTAYSGTGYCACFIIRKRSTEVK